MNLIQIKSQLSVTYDELTRYATLKGYAINKQVLINAVNESVRPKEDTIKAVKAAFLAAADMYNPKLCKEVNKYFKKKYGV